MQVETRSITVDTDASSLFEFVSDLENLPRWAIHFAKAVRKKGTDWHVQTGRGEVVVAVDADPRTGVVDYLLRPAPGVELPVRTRVVPNGDRAEYIFTLFREPESTEDAFREGVRSVEDELRVLAQAYANDDVR